MNDQNHQEDEWLPPHLERQFHPRKERPPILRWLLAAALLLAILTGAAWLAAQTIVKDPPVRSANNEAVEEVVQEPIEEAAEDKRLTDSEAWVRALEKDTLEGYREYLDLFPNGRHKDEAQAEIDGYDDRAWATAEQRDTIPGYEDYLETWPEGRHASQARERIAELKAEAEAAQEDAAERRAQDAADWEKAARENTVASYDEYLRKHPTGANAPEAQKRRDALEEKAADQSAWQRATELNTVAGYEQYLTSFPNGAHTMEAVAAIERLKPAAGRDFKDCAVCPTMITLPTGSAELGAGDGDTQASPNERPARPVTFTRMFAISTREVTFSEWQACVNAGGCSATPSDNGWGQGNRPVINVSWDDAQKYVVWLSQTTGQSYSLPSEAQWEYAARAGDTGVLPGGSAAALCAFANGAAQESGLQWANKDCLDPAGDRTMPAGTLAPNMFGLYDMFGNVAEWTLDCNTLNLRDAPSDGGADQRGSCNQRVTRGGSWFSGPSDLRYTARMMQRRGDSNDFTGFRVVRNVSP